MPRSADPGVLHDVSDDDRAWMRQRMEERSIGMVKLAKLVGISRQALYQLLNGETRHSWQWAAIVKHLGGKPPSAKPTDDERLTEIMRRWPEMTDDDRALVLATVLRLAKKP